MEIRKSIEYNIVMHAYQMEGTFTNIDDLLLFYEIKIV